MKEFSVFDIIGPSMVGPSSSHTAGAVRIGLVANKLAAGERIKLVELTLYGSFAETGFGHGTDRALLAGVLGVSPDDARVRFSMLLARSEGIWVEIKKGDIEQDHPNTATIRIRTVSGREFRLTGISVGGGNIEIIDINGMEVSFTGDYPTMIAFYRDVPGVISKVTNILALEHINVAFMKVFRNAKRRDACMVIETDAPIPNASLERIKTEIDGIEEICTV
ncbi:MAG: L-serine ammonia-lyase, iron-sulfur-dependent subunit beta [Clostridia bacterium]|nr:L-serine ammonia-lyase, iron-sulfur-dependent subunit beta [Clostridia bacterium]